MPTPVLRTCHLYTCDGDAIPTYGVLPYSMIIIYNWLLNFCFLVRLRRTYFSVEAKKVCLIVFNQHKFVNMSSITVTVAAYISSCIAFLMSCQVMFVLGTVHQETAPTRQRACLWHLWENPQPSHVTKSNLLPRQWCTHVDAPYWMLPIKRQHIFGQILKCSDLNHGF